MLAVVKTPHIEINIKGKIDKELITFLKSHYGKRLKLSSEKSELEKQSDVTTADWFIQLKKKSNPGQRMKVYRLNQNMTQTNLGKKLGSFQRHHISEMESGKRGISKETAKKLAIIFQKPIEIFL